MEPGGIEEIENMEVYIHTEMQVIWNTVDLHPTIKLRNYDLFYRVVPDIRPFLIPGIRPDIRLNCWTNDAKIEWANFFSETFHQVMWISNEQTLFQKLFTKYKIRLK